MWSSPERIARIEEKKGQALAQSKKKGAAGAQEEAEGRALQDAIRRLLSGLPATLFKDRGAAVTKVSSSRPGIPWLYLTGRDDDQ